MAAVNATKFMKFISPRKKSAKIWLMSLFCREGRQYVRNLCVRPKPLETAWHFKTHGHSVGNISEDCSILRLAMLMKVAYMYIAHYTLTCRCHWVKRAICSCISSKNFSISRNLTVNVCSQQNSANQISAAAVFLAQSDFLFKKFC